MRSSRACATIAAVWLTLGCHSYRPVTATRPVAPDRRIRISFAPPRDVRVVRYDGTALTLPTVSRLEGRVVRLAADTVYVAVGISGGQVPRSTASNDGVGTGVLQVAGDHSMPAQAAIVPDANTRMEVLQLAKGKTTVLTFGILVTLLGIMAVGFATSSSNLGTFPITGDWEM